MARATEAGFPWRRPRHEGLVLALVAFAVLTPIYVVSSQDVSRLCLSRALIAEKLTISPCAGNTVDRASYGGRIYSDKAPGLSLIAIPEVAATSLPASAAWHFGRDLRIWAVRVLTSGIAFLLLCFALGRVAEGLVEGTGALTTVTFALGTLAGGLAATAFDHIFAAALCFAAFLLAWRQRPALAGLLAGFAVAFEYQAALAVAVISLYVALAGGRNLFRYLCGAAPGLTTLAAYDWAAFGSPLHASYTYVANRYAREQAAGFFGISLPRWHSVALVLFGDRGLLVASPVVVAAAVGLVLLARTHPREALVCGGVAICFLLLEFGYFLPYGGVSPGPRFLVPALPFVALGLPAALTRFGTVTKIALLASIVSATTLELTWSWGSALGYRQTVWGEVVRAVQHTHSRLRDELAGNILTTTGVRPWQAALAVLVSACVAFGVAAIPEREDSPT